MKTILEIEKSISSVVLAAGLRGEAQAVLDGLTREEKIKRTYAEMEWARLNSTQPNRDLVPPPGHE